jgi:hypothetical protein
MKPWLQLRRGCSCWREWSRECMGTRFNGAWTGVGGEQQPAHSEMAALRREVERRIVVHEHLHGWVRGPLARWPRSARNHARAGACRVSVCVCMHAHVHMHVCMPGIVSCAHVCEIARTPERSTRVHTCVNGISRIRQNVGLFVLLSSWLRCGRHLLQLGAKPTSGGVLQQHRRRRLHKAPSAISAPAGQRGRKRAAPNRAPCLCAARPSRRAAGEHRLGWSVPPCGPPLHRLHRQEAPTQAVQSVKR